MTSNYRCEEPESIQALFDDIAPRYDLGNALLSFGLHRRWNRALRIAMEQHLANGPLLDLCTGTGAIALDCLTRLQNPMSAYLLDFSSEMLAIAKQRALQLTVAHDLHFIQADAAKIPLPTSSIQVVTTAYGIRNVHNRIGCAGEVARVLCPGGRWLILELTRPRFFLLRWLHAAHLKVTLPLLGGLLTTNKEAYRYLSSSIQHFVSPDQLIAECATAGFQVCRVTAFLGGIATLIELTQAQ